MISLLANRHSYWESDSEDEEGEFDPDFHYKSAIEDSTAEGTWLQ